MLSQAENTSMKVDKGFQDHTQTYLFNFVFGNNLKLKNVSRIEIGPRTLLSFALFSPSLSLDMIYYLWYDIITRFFSESFQRRSIPMNRGILLHNNSTVINFAKFNTCGTLSTICIQVLSFDSITNDLNHIFPPPVCTGPIPGLDVTFSDHISLVSFNPQLVFVFYDWHFEDKGPHAPFFVFDSFDQPSYF